VALWPTVIEDAGGATTLKPAPEIVAWEILTGAVPVFLTLRLCLELLPTETLPKLRLVELAESTPETVPGLVRGEDAFV
jgi:hypothetical protein